MDKIRNQAIIDSKFPLPYGEMENLHIYSNAVAVQNISGMFHKIRTSSRYVVPLYHGITYTITLDNTSDFSIFDIKIHDILPNEWQFEEKSLQINGITYPNLNPINGFVIDTPLPPHCRIVITYRAKLMKMPQTEKSTSFSEVTFSVNKMKNVTEITNKIDIEPMHNLITIEQSADKTTANRNEIIKFTNKITNRGAELQNPAFFKVQIPKQARFVAKSVTINQERYVNLDPKIGFQIKKLKTDETLIIAFEVKIL